MVPGSLYAAGGRERDLVQTLVPHEGGKDRESERERERERERENERERERERTRARVRASEGGRWRFKGQRGFNNVSSVTLSRQV